MGPSKAEVSGRAGSCPRSASARRAQFATLAALDRVSASYVTRQHVEAGGLMAMDQPFGHVSSGRRLYRQHPKRGREREQAGVVLRSRAIGNACWYAANLLVYVMPLTDLAGAEFKAAPRSVKLVKGGVP
jgi:hypothetical protein